jgi:pre-mRNA-splicing factor ISY1
VTAKPADGDVEMDGAKGDPHSIARAAAMAAASFIPFLTVEHLLPPKLPTREEMDGVLLGLRKRALVEEYFG